MFGKQTIRCLSFGALFFLILVSCQGAEVNPNASPGAITETQMRSNTSPSASNTQVSSTMLSVTETGTQTWTPTIHPQGYTLKDWLEPLEVITQENIDRVEKIGELDFSSTVSDFAWSPDGSRFGVSLQGPLFVLDSHTFQSQWLLSGYLVAFSYDGLILENGGSQFDMATGERLGSIESGSLTRYPGSIVDIEFSPNGKYIAAAGTEFAQIYSMQAGIENGRFGRYAASAMHTSISPDGTLVAVNYINEAFTELWDPYSRKPIRILKVKEITGQGKPRFSADGKSLFFTGNGKWDEQEVTFIQEWEYRTGEPVGIKAIQGNSMEKGSSMDISPFSDVAVLGTKNGRIYLLPLRACKVKEIGETTPPKIPVYIVSFRPDGKLIATVGYTDSSIELWGIPASDSTIATAVPDDDPNETQIYCSDIPMTIENPLPIYDWFGGGRPYEG
jgi:WD40 repeat protein